MSSTTNLVDTQLVALMVGSFVSPPESLRSIWAVQRRLYCWWPAEKDLAARCWAPGSMIPYKLEVMRNLFPSLVMLIRLGKRTLPRARSRLS